jgi:ribosome-associated protein
MHDSDPSDFPKSKSLIKKEMIELQELGERLVLLSQDQLTKLNLSAALLQAVLEAKRITSGGAKRRQLQYIGRLMRDLEDPQSIRDYFLKVDTKDKKAIAFQHMLEAWRERLITEDAALTQFIEAFPDTDRQHLRQLIQKAKKERSHGKSLGAAKALFRYLRELQETAGHHDES